MDTYIKVNNNEYPATITGALADYEWNNRSTKTIRLTTTYSNLITLMPTNTHWAITQHEEVAKYNENGEPTGETEEVVSEWDNSEYCLAGPIIDHRDGTVSIKMGKPTEAELLSAQLAQIEEAFDEQ